MDKFMNQMLDKLSAVSLTDEPLSWKRNDFAKIVDEIYIQGFNDGEKVVSNVRITSQQGKRFKVKRSELDFNSFIKLCQKLEVRLDAEGIDFIGFDVHAYKMNGEEYQNVKGMEIKEELCLESTPLM